MSNKLVTISAHLHSILANVKLQNNLKSYNDAILFLCKTDTIHTTQNQLDNPIIPDEDNIFFDFGKYKNQKVKNIQDTKYLNWVINTITFTEENQALKNAIQKKLQKQ